MKSLGWRQSLRTAAVVLTTLSLFSLHAFAAHHRLSTEAQYHKYIDPLVAEKDFGVEYYDDGAADASVLYPTRNGNQYARPSDSVLEIVRAGAKAFPALIDCLTDQRMTSVPFDGNNITRKMDVAVGYVCMDILMAEAQGPNIDDPEGGDGLGAGIMTNFYFRPDDYSNCWPTTSRTCDPRPWVFIVQANWTRKFLTGQLRFKNPYDAWHIPEYAPYTSRALNRQK